MVTGAQLDHLKRKLMKKFYQYGLSREAITIFFYSEKNRLFLYHDVL